MTTFESRKKARNFQEDKENRKSFQTEGLPWALYRVNRVRVLDGWIRENKETDHKWPLLG